MEGQSLRVAILRLGTALWLAMVAAGLLFAGLLLMAWGFEHWLVGLFGPVAAHLGTGVVLLCLAGVVGWWSKSRIR